MIEKDIPKAVFSDTRNVKFEPVKKEKIRIIFDYSLIDKEVTDKRMCVKEGDAVS